MNIQLAILIVYGAVLIGISWWSTKLQKKAIGSKMLSYLLAGRNMPAVVICVMLVGLAVGGASTVGVAERAYTAGFSAGWYNAAWGMGGIAVGFFVAKFFRKISVKTIPEMMGLMFGPKTRFLSVVNQLLVMISITALQYVAGGSILRALLPDVFSFQGGLITTALIFIFITVIGGYWASGLTNLINVTIIYAGIIVALVKSIRIFGGMGTIIAALPPPPPRSGTWFDLVSGLGTAVVAGYVAVMVTMAISTQAVAQITFAAKNEKTAKWGFLAGGIIILPAGFLCAVFGIIARSQFPNLENAAMALPTIAAQLSPFVGGIFLASLWAADISTAVGLLMGCSTLVLEDIVKKLHAKPIKKEHELLVSRLTVLGVSLLSFLLALTVVGILRTITTALALTTSFTLLILADIYFPRLNRKAAGFWIVLLSLLLWILWTCFPQFRIGPELIYMEWIGCGALFILFALLTKEPANRLVPQEEKE